MDRAFSKRENYQVPQKISWLINICLQTKEGVSRVWYQKEEDFEDKDYLARSCKEDKARSNRGQG
jgi:hypothetical protein